MNLLTIIAFSQFDSGAPPFIPDRKKALTPIDIFTPVADQMIAFLNRFFEEPMIREYLIDYQPILLPRDSITVPLFALNILKNAISDFEFATACVLVKNRVLISTAGPVMTTILQLFAAFNKSTELFVNRQFHYLGQYFKKFESQRLPIEEQQARFFNAAQGVYQTLFVSIFTIEEAQLCVVSNKQFDFSESNDIHCQFNFDLAAISDKCDALGFTPPTYTQPELKSDSSFLPIRGQVDVCGKDQAGMFRAFRGCQTAQLFHNRKVDYGFGLLDADVISLFNSRGAEYVEAVLNEQEVVTNDPSIRMMFPNFSGDDSSFSMSNYDSQRQTRRIICNFKSDGKISVCGATVDDGFGKRNISSTQQKYCQIRKDGYSFEQLGDE